MNNQESKTEPPIGIGLIGCGTVGTGVAKLLHEEAAWYARRLGRPMEIRRALVRDATLRRDTPLDPDLFTDDPEAFFQDESVSIVIEVAGGLDPVEGYVRRALSSGRHVITANKALLAARGVELCATAREHGTAIAFEASCAGGIPILAALKFGLSANRIDAIYGILNGTCNYVLTQMTERGADYNDALKEAQDRGFAEADPTLDVNGADAAQKLSIIATLAFGEAVNEDDVNREGIDQLTLEDIRFGADLGYQIKLLAIGERRPGGLLLRVRPCFVANEEPLAQVREAFNAISVHGHAVGPTMYYGHGAGQMPTASAIVGDLINVANGWYPHAFKTMRIWPDQHQPTKLLDTDDAISRYFVRVDGRDEPGVLAKIAAVLGEHRVSISSVLQHESDDNVFTPMVITTHAAAEGALERAADALSALDIVRTRPICIRIVD